MLEADVRVVPLHVIIGVIRVVNMRVMEHVCLNVLVLQNNYENKKI